MLFLRPAALADALANVAAFAWQRRPVPVRPRGANAVPFPYDPVAQTPSRSRTTPWCNAVPFPYDLLLLVDQRTSTCSSSEGTTALPSKRRYVGGPGRQAIAVIGHARLAAERALMIIIYIHPFLDVIYCR